MSRFSLPHVIWSYLVVVTFILSAVCVATPGNAAASFSEARELYDWGTISGPRVLASEDTPLAPGSQTNGYLVVLPDESNPGKTKTFLTQEGGGLLEVTLPAEVNVEDVKGSFLAVKTGSQAAAPGEPVKLDVAVPAPAPQAPADATAQADAGTEEATIQLPEPGVKPDSRVLSFFERAGENTRRFFIFNPKARAEYGLRLAQERLSETKALLAENNVAAAERAASSYRAAAERLGGSVGSIGEGDEASIESIRQAMAAQAAFLATDLATSAPPEFKQALESASQSTGKALAAIADKRGEQPLPPEAIKRIQDAVSLGSMGPSDAAVIFGAANRTEALKTVEGLVKNGVMAAPDADYLRFDAIRQTHKNSFDKAHEINKLRYIEDSQEGLKKIADDPALKQKIQDFGQNFQAGQQPPPELRQYWALSVNAENAQQTFKPEVLKDVLKADAGRNEELIKFYTSARDNLRPTQGEAESAARQQSEFTRILPQFSEVIRKAGPGVREDGPAGFGRTGFSGCKNVSECITKAEEFQSKYKDAPPEVRRSFLQDEFLRVEQVNLRPPVGQPGQLGQPGNNQSNGPNRGPTMGTGGPCFGPDNCIGGGRNELPNELKAGRPPEARYIENPNKPGTYNPNPNYKPPSGDWPAYDPNRKDYPDPKFINPGPSALLRQGSSEPLKPGEARFYPGAPNSPSDANRPPGQYQPPAGYWGGSSGGSYNPPPPPSSGGSEPSGGGAPPPPPSGGDSGGGGGDSGGGAPPPSDGGGGGGDSGGGAPPPPSGP